MLVATYAVAAVCNATWWFEEASSPACASCGFAGFGVPITQFGSAQNEICTIGAANHPGITQANWTSCFSCTGYSLNKCTKVAGSPNATDQFSLFRSE